MDALDVISSGRKNRKAKELIASSEKMVDDIDSEIKETDTLFESDLQMYMALRKDVLAHSLQTFDDTYIEIQNVDFEGSDVTYANESMEDVGEEFYNCKHEIEPVVINKVKTAAVGAIMGGLFAGIATLAAAVSVAVMQTGMKIDLQQMPSQDQITSLLEWFGGGMLQEGSTDMMNGAYILGGGAGAVALITGYLILNARSRKNLMAAEATFSEATASHLDKSSQNRKTMSMTQYIETLQSNLKTSQIYLDEYNAVLRRIIHIEGTDYSAYSVKSQSDVRTTLSIYKLVKSLISTKIVASDGTVDSISKYEVEKSAGFLKEMAKK